MVEVIRWWVRVVWSDGCVEGVNQWSMHEPLRGNVGMGGVKDCKVFNENISKGCVAFTNLCSVWKSPPHRMRLRG
jgi:hypothetical protein